jgi:P2 family phage contractile tail tube protein
MSIIIQEGQSLTCGDTGPGNVKYNNLDSMQLPDLEEISEAHHAGGSKGEVEWGNLGMKALQPTFKIKGHDPQLVGLIGQQKRTIWTARGILRDKQTQVPTGVRAVIEARLGKIGQDGFERGKILGHDHGMNEVVAYALYYDEREVYYWSFFEVAFRVNGVDQLADERRLLGLPG